MAAPEGIDLTGVWTIDRERSDGPEKAHELDRREGKEPMRVRVGGSLGALGGLGGGVGNPGKRNADSDGGREGMDERIQQLFAARERIEILQLPDSVDLKFSDRYVTCTSTAKTQLALLDGSTANRTCGWDGNEFIVEFQDSKGDTRTDRYSRGDSETLVVKSTVKVERMPKRELKRVYLRSDSN